MIEWEAAPTRPFDTVCTSDDALVHQGSYPVDRPGTVPLDGSFPVTIMVAEVPDATAFAMGMVRKADHLSMSHQVAVDVVPPVPGGDLHQCVLGPLGVLRVHQSHEVRDPVDVGVDTDRRYAHRVGTHACGGLPPHHGQRYQLLRGLRYLATVLVPEDLATFDDGRPLLLGEAGGTYEFGHDGGVRIGDLLYGIVLTEQVVGCPAGVVVTRTLGEYGCNQDMERVRRPLGVQTLRITSRVRSAQVLLG